MILVSLMGDFDSSILPIFYEFKEQISHHILIHDDGKHDIDKTNRIIQSQHIFKKLYNYSYGITSLKIDEDSVESILKVFNSILEISKKQTILFNGTDGLTNVSIIVAGQLFSNNGKFITYDMHENEYNLLTISDMKKYKIINNMQICNHLILKGFEIESYSKPNEMNSRKNQIFSLTKNLSRYKDFTTVISNTDYGKITNFDDIKVILNSIPNTIIDKKFIQGVVFEEYIYWVIKDNLIVDDILCGVKIKFDHEVQNEFDILFIINNHLHQIECKFVNSLDGERFVYKTHSTIEQLDDEGKGMIVSIGANNKIIKGKNIKKQFTDGDFARAKKENIYIYQSKKFDMTIFIENVANFFGLERK